MDEKKPSADANSFTHRFTYIGLFAFTFLVYFRPYDLFPALAEYQSMAFVAAASTILLYIPTQLNAEGRLTFWTTELVCVLALLFFALLSLFIAIDPGLAWLTLTDVFLKVVLIFLIMVNVLRTKARINGLMYLAIGAGVLLSYQAVDLYSRGIFDVEGYRVNLDHGGMFNNPNDLALHLVIFLPIAVVLGIHAKSFSGRLVYFVAGGIMIAGIMVTQSRGGFLGLLAVTGVLVWKLGRQNRVKILFITMIAASLFIALAPGNYGVRIASIFQPDLDPVGSASQRTDSLVRSIVVTLRNPLGIGLGNSPIVGIRNLETHNAYTQVSSELGWFALGAYMMLLLSPIRKMLRIERFTINSNPTGWYHLVSVGIQASIAGYLVSSFFGSVAYQWYVYYPIAYAVGIYRMYHEETRTIESMKETSAT